MKLINLLGLILIIAVAFTQARPNLRVTDDEVTTDYPRRAKKSERSFKYLPMRG